MARLQHEGLRRYEERLRTLPASGGGGCHPALLGCATLGVRAGVEPERICRDLRGHVHGTRIVTDREIDEAVAKAMNDSDSWQRRQPKRSRADRGEALRKVVNAGREVGEADVVEKSSIRIDWPPEEDSWRVLEALYAPDEHLYIGQSKSAAHLGCELRPVQDWIARFQAKGPGSTSPHVIPNPLTGLPAPKASGQGHTLRGDACVAAFRYAVVEFDEMSREDQLAFWWAARLPVAVLVDSGGKSIHGWVRIQAINDAAEWTRVVERHLFDSLLRPLGVDGACKNESRLSRMPGHRRKETGRWQRLLYLAPEGKAVAA